MYQYVKTYTENGAGYIILNDPKKLNALSQPMAAELSEVLEQFRFDPSIRVIVLRGEGGKFCAGGDITSMKKRVDCYAAGIPVKEKVEVTIRAFKVVKTFDLSQTDGKELPTIGPSELVGNIEGYPKLLQALQEISPVPVSFELIDGNAKGFYHLEDKKIVVQDGMSEVQTIKTLLHEMAHQKLHDKDNVPEAKDISRNGKEVEAESVAYVVCQHYGINTSDYSFSYVAGWSEGKETPELKASLDKIRQTASEFIYQIDQKMEVLMADKEQVQESAKAPSPFVQELMDKITEGAKDLGFIPVVPETQEKTANPELKVVVDKALKDLDKKRTLSKVKESVKSKLKSNTEKAEQAPRKSRISKAKEERA